MDLRTYRKMFTKPRTILRFLCMYSSRCISYSNHDIKVNGATQPLVGHSLCIYVADWLILVWCTIFFLIMCLAVVFCSPMVDLGKGASFPTADNPFARLPDHILVEIFIRVPITEWSRLSCVKKQWANLFREECLWHAALIRTFPFAGLAKRWPGPIPRGMSKRRYAALYISKHMFSLDDEVDEIVGHSYLFLKEQLEISKMPPPSGILHGTIIDQFIACGKSRDKAHELASLIWLAVIDNMEENEQTLLILKRLASEGDVILPFPYSRSSKVQWRVFDRLFTDFRDCLNHVKYCEILAYAKQRFQPIPSSWLGY